MIWSVSFSLPSSVPPSFSPSLPLSIFPPSNSLMHLSKTKYSILNESINSINYQNRSVLLSMSAKGFWLIKPLKIWHCVWVGLRGKDFLEKTPCVPIVGWRPEIKTCLVACLTLWHWCGAIPSASSQLLCSRSLPVLTFHRRFQEASQKQRKSEPEKVPKSKTRREDKGGCLSLEDSQGHRLGGGGAGGQGERVSLEANWPSDRSDLRIQK